MTSAITLWRDCRTDEFLSRWWDVSRRHAVLIVVGRLLRSIAIDTLAMLFANWLRAVI